MNDSLYDCLPWFVTVYLDDVYIRAAEVDMRILPRPFKEEGWKLRLKKCFFDLDALAICEAVKHSRHYMEGCSMFLVVTYHNTLPHVLTQPNSMLNKRQARYLLDLHSIVGIEIEFV
jgi:hypothetical protein